MKSDLIPVIFTGYALEVIFAFVAVLFAGGAVVDAGGAVDGGGAVVDAPSKRLIKILTKSTKLNH